MFGHLIITFCFDTTGRQTVRLSNNWNLICVSKVPTSLICNLRSEICIPSSKLIINFSLMADLPEGPNNIQVRHSQNTKRLSHFNNVWTVISVISLWNCRCVHVCVCVPTPFTCHPPTKKVQSVVLNLYNWHWHLWTITVLPGCKKSGNQTRVWVGLVWTPL